MIVNFLHNLHTVIVFILLIIITIIKAQFTY